MTRKLEPRFDRSGQYVLKTQRDRLAAAIATLRSVATIPQAYHSQGPAAQVEMMRREALATIQAIQEAV